jgi:hypothetical protein
MHWQDKEKDKEGHGKKGLRPDDDTSEPEAHLS